MKNNGDPPILALDRECRYIVWNEKGNTMKVNVNGVVCGVLFAWMFSPAAALACDPVEDGCLGCRDAELPVCVGKLVGEICMAGGGDNFCDKRSATEDIERLVLRNTGVHMSRIRGLVRGAVKYQRPHSPRF